MKPLGGIVFDPVNDSRAQPGAEAFGEALIR